MSDETNVNYTEISDHNELMEYIRRLLEKIRLLTGMYENNLALLTEHNEADNSHADIRELILADRDAASKLVAELKSDIDDTINGVNKVLDEHDKRMWDITEVNNVQNDRLDAIELDLPLKIYDKDVSAIGHTGDFDDALYRPNITISDADKTNTGASVKLTKNKTELYLPNTIKATFVGNLTGNASSATKLQTARTINGTSFNGTANITTANWGTARNISITDGTNTSTAVSVNGSKAYSLNLPSTIKATFVGNLTGNVTGNCSGTAGGVAWTNVSGRPTKVSQFTNDSGYITTNGAAYPRRVGGVTMNFNWSGKGGQPTWLWGGEDGVNMYVYNPANFSVNYANSAGSASSATTATYASRSTSNGGFYISNHLVTIE